MHEMAAQLCDSQAYRPGDVRLMMNRVHQLDRQLPLQWMRAQVPIENTLGGYQLFNNGVTDLAPELHGWYGAPGIALYTKQPPPACQGCNSCASPKSSKGGAGTVASSGQQTSSSNDASGDGGGGIGNGGGSGASNSTSPSSNSTKLANDATKLAGETVKLATDVVNLTSSSLKTITDAAAQASKASNQVAMPPDCDCSGTTVFLVGNHFSIVDTKVIAGGVCIPRDAISLLSRQVMKVTIPWNAKTVTIDKGIWIDVHVATPYGVTGHLHIPAYYADSPSADAKQLNQIATAISPLEIMLDQSQQLVVKFQYDGDVKPGKLTQKSTQTIKMKCVDQAVCQANPEGMEQYAVYTVVYDGKKKLGQAELAETDMPAKLKDWPLNLDANVLWEKIYQGIFQRPGSPAYQSLGTLYDADKENLALSVVFYLRGAGLPDLHVIGTLPLKFEEVDDAGQPPSAHGQIIRSLPAVAESSLPAPAHGRTQAVPRIPATSRTWAPLSPLEQLPVPNVNGRHGALPTSAPNQRIQPGPTLAPAIPTSSVERLPVVRPTRPSDYGRGQRQRIPSNSEYQLGRAGSDEARALWEARLAEPNYPARAPLRR
jgi:hypothetical protein